jgi:hypothetical protein
VRRRAMESRLKPTWHYQLSISIDGAHDGAARVRDARGLGAGDH